MPLKIDGATLRGSLDAPVVLMEWSDYQCPYCARAEREVLTTIHEKYVMTNRVLFAFRHYPLTKIHPQAAKAAEAALCAGQQGRFWEMHAGLFETPGKLAQSDLIMHAVALKLNKQQFADCLARNSMAGIVDEDAKSAIAFGLTGTPAFLVGRREADGRVRVTAVLKGARPLNDFTQAIEAAESSRTRARTSNWVMGIGVAILVFVGLALASRTLARASRRGTADLPSSTSES